MKRNYTVYMFVFIVLLAVGIYRSSAQTVTAIVYYTGAQALGCCSMGNADYWCIDNTGGCGQTGTCDSKTFMNPVPPGNIVTNIVISYYTGQCEGSAITGSINGITFPTIYESSTGCTCATNPYSYTDPTTTTTFPCGITGYNYSGLDTLQLCTGVDVCITQANITISYAPNSQSTPPAAPGAISGNNPICYNSSQTYSIAAVAGAASYTWAVPSGWTINSGGNTNSITVTVGPSSGTIYVTPSNLCGTSGPASFPVTVNPLPVAPASANANNNNFCPGAFPSVSLTGNGGSGSTMNWYNGSCGGFPIGSGTNFIINPAPTVTTTYYADWTNNCGTSGCANVTVNINPVPTPSILGTSSICSGNAATLDAGSGYSSYSWSTGAATEFIYPTTSGPYTVTVSNSSNCTGTASTSVTVNPSLNPTITAPVSICSGVASTLDAGAGYTTYFWSTGATTDTITVTTSGTYKVTVSDASGCTGTASAVVNLTPNLTPTISGPSSICTGYAGTLNAGSGYSTYLWSTNSTTDTIIVTSPGSYTVTVSNSSGCTGTSSFVVTVNPSLSPTITGPSAICNGNSATLDAGAGYSTYLWSTGAATETISVISAGTFTVTVSDASTGCSGTTSLTVSISSAPVVTTGPAVSICPGSSTTLNASGGSSYSWSPYSSLDNPFISNPVATPTSTTTYTVTAYNAIGCSGTANVVVSTYPTSIPVILSSSLKGFCDSSSVSDTLNAGSGYSQYSWSTGASTQKIFVNQVGTYTVTVVDAHGCTYSSVGVNLFVAPPVTKPIILAASSPVFCKGDSVMLYVNNPYYTYHWSSGSVPVSQVWAYESETFVVTVSDSFGCTNVSDPFVVKVDPLPVAHASDYNNLLNVSFYDFSLNATSWNWNFGDGQSSTLQDPTHIYDTAGTYTVILTAIDSCGSDNDTLIIIVPGPAGIIGYGYDFENLLVYPVPVSENVFISFNATNYTNAELKLYDVLGKVIYDETLSDVSGKYIKNINMTGQSSGLYFVELRSDKSFVIRKFSKQ